LSKPIKMLSNLYPFRVNLGGKHVIFEYKVNSAPLLSCHTNKEKQTLWTLINDDRLKNELESLFDSYLYFEGYIYSFEKVDDTLLPSWSISHEDVAYKINFEYHQGLDFTHASAPLFFRAYMNELIKKTGFK